MSECSCVWVGDTDCGQYMLQEKKRVARKVHVCCECGNEVAPGEIYMFEQMVFEGKIDTFKTCMVCLAIRDEMFCDGWFYECMYEFLDQHISDVDGQIKESCLLRLPPPARNRVLAMIDEHFECTKERG